RLPLREEPAGLELEQRGDQDEELAARVEVELVALGEPGDESDHDLGEVELAERHLLAEDEREQEVERALERVEVEQERPYGFLRHSARLSSRPDAARRDRHRRALRDLARLHLSRRGGVGGAPPGGGEPPSARTGRG